MNPDVRSGWFRRLVQCPVSHNTPVVLMAHLGHIVDLETKYGEGR